MAKPEVLYSVGFRAERRVTFEAKESALFEMPKRGGTRGIATLGDHDSTPSAPVGLLIFYLDGYLLHSPSPYRLWFRVGLDSGVKDLSQGNGFDCQRLLHEAEEELAATF